MSRCRSWWRIRLWRCTSEQLNGFRVPDRSLLPSHFVLRQSSGRFPPPRADLLSESEPHLCRSRRHSRTLYRPSGCARTIYVWSGSTVGRTCR